MQDKFDDLYNKSLKGYKFTKLMELISDDKNILLAYRNIKRNKGSETAGTDKLNIKYIENMPKEEFLSRIKSKLANYHPKSVRRVEIPKPNGKKRPLGIPCIEDRIIQQCIKQILEPICEAKFHKHSYGFRPNRATSHAIARSTYLISRCKMHYVVDIDIKGFFDNVNHSKLIKQMWSLGIQDKNLICVIKKILKSEIEGIGIPTKGTPQGGIISPLLSNIVLNELDWWLSNQWETFETKKNYSIDRTKENKGIDHSHKYRALRNSNLKEFYFVRYADDFKIFCKDYNTALKIFKATTKWLEERLGLEISEEKSKITNLRKNNSEFLGFKFRVVPKNKGYVCRSEVSDKAKSKIKNNLKKQIKIIQRSEDKKEIVKLNAMIMGMHNYYKNATMVSRNFGEINFLVKKTLEVRLKYKLTNKANFNKTYEKLYGRYKGKCYTINGITLFPLYGCKFVTPLGFNQEICNYTEKGRILIHDGIRGYEHLIRHLLKNRTNNDDTELEDNKISLIVGQRGKCYITGINLDILDMECHHKVPISMGGDNKYDNLVWLSYYAHKIVHCRKEETINKYLQLMNLNEKEIKKVNSLRKLVGNSIIN